MPATGLPTAPWSHRNQNNLITKFHPHRVNLPHENSVFRFYLSRTTWSLQKYVFPNQCISITAETEKTETKKCTRRIKLIWNLEIYDFHNPFDRTAYKTFYSDGDDDYDAVDRRLSSCPQHIFNLLFSFSPHRFHSFSFCFHLVD